MELMQGKGFMISTKIPLPSFLWRLGTLGAWTFSRSLLTLAIVPSVDQAVWPTQIAMDFFLVQYWYWWCIKYQSAASGCKTMQKVFLIFWRTRRRLISRKQTTGSPTPTDRCAHPSTGICNKAKILTFSNTGIKWSRNNQLNDIENNVNNQHLVQPARNYGKEQTKI